ncbi:hypothetical protein [Sulfurimonas sp.]|uniref:hypothetical protein n=1 Tax=Sulfurimonas sp. TaxID=2022749 RepID=UPI00260D8B36|nr:hypothetical protein [Sulfurimonas sp.]MDD5156874.1 hypothetical protein [Sulfurimonas sp.]
MIPLSCICDKIVRLSVSFSQSDIFVDGVKKYCNLRLIFNGDIKKCIYSTLFSNLDFLASQPVYDSNRISYVFRDLIYIGGNNFKITLDYYSRLASGFPYTWKTTTVSLSGSSVLSSYSSILEITT